MIDNFLAVFRRLIITRLGMIIGRRLYGRLKAVACLCFDAIYFNKNVDRRDRQRTRRRLSKSLGLGGI